MVVLVGLSLTACGSGAAGLAANDVSVSTCGPGAGGGTPTATGRIHNTTPHRSSYFIRMQFVDPAGKVVGEAMSAVGRLNSGATASWSAASDHPASEPFTCKVAGVTRTVAS
jgi:hypothetical protein